MISVILPVHNRCNVTSLFLDSLLEQDTKDFLLVLVDDGCTDGTVEMVRNRVNSNRLVVLAGDGNLWWGGALQLAWVYLQRQKMDREDAVLIINDDVKFGPEFLSAGLSLLRDDPMACYQAVCRDMRDGSLDSGTMANLVQLRFRGISGDETPNCLSTRGLMMSGGSFLRSGGFRPRLLPHYLSDYEFTLRLAKQGLTLRTHPSFSLLGDSELTGFSANKGRGIRQLVSQAFSNRSKNNPLHWSVFAVLCCPWWVLPIHLFRIWARFAVNLLFAYLRSLK